MWVPGDWNCNAFLFGVTIKGRKSVQVILLQL